ncbi:MAG: hypothetical protein CFE23_15700 [Flavobacterium sp. BFFFF1]|uniref:hypothetical protein n=1 Tax=Flavobacterium sp. BFFFF1 TaxID=2015557 RepID=UPI000BDD1A2F|nr:hypothetical protein [Flavobacterium sp. BFFFF1]OYU79101.1 MAG: hypothetical protein CFE23_15700 [Flavobacterium sp. BFFFF1]
MKKLLLLAALLISATTFAQVPQGISYQAIALNGSGNPVVSTNVGIRLSILDASATGTTLYTETQTKTTTAQGLFNLVIGQGTPVSGTFAGINWKTNSKFLKVEMDIAGGSNYVLVGTTQLLSVPYALAAKSLVLAPGEGITLTSPNGTPYQLTVNDAGSLSLPTAANPNNYPADLYLYGTFNGFNTSTAQLLNYNDSYFTGFKYLTGGSQIKLISSTAPNAAVYGNSGGMLVLNGSAFTAPSSGLYWISVSAYDGDNGMYLDVTQFVPKVFVNTTSMSYNMTYNAATNTASATVTGILSGDNFYFKMPHPNSGNFNYGDYLADGTAEMGGTEISFPGASASVPKNYKIDFVINVNGTGAYTVTQVP